MTMTTSGLPGLLDGLDLIRADFPILARTMADGHPLVYLDSANTSQKPQVVIDAMVDHLEHHNANVARAMHQLGAESTAGFEGGRDKVAAFLNAPSRDEVIFTKNASEAINLVANTLAWARGPLEVGPGDEVLVTEMEHHSNIVPWQLLTERKGATLRWFGITDDGRLDLSNIDELINERTKVVSLTWVSNMLGTVNPVAEIARRAHEVGAARAGRRGPGRPADAGRPGWHGRGQQARLPGVHRPQGHRPHRHRGAVGPPGGARAAASVPRRWRDDRDRGDGAVDVRRDPAAGSRPAPRRSSRRSGSVRRSTTSPPSAWTTSAPTRRPSPRTRWRAWPPSGASRCSARSRRRCGAEPSRSRSTASTRTTSARCSTAGASPCGPGTTAPSPRTSGSGCRARPGCRRTSTRHPAEIDALVEGLEYTKKYFKVD